MHTLGNRDRSGDASPAAGVPLIDLVAVTFIAAAGIALLLDVHRAAAQRGIAVAVVAAGRAVSRPLGVTGVDKTIPVYPNRSAALLELVQP